VAAALTESDPRQDLDDTKGTSASDECAGA
jgi:hypothetical protein